MATAIADAPRRTLEDAHMEIVQASGLGDMRGEESQRRWVLSKVISDPLIRRLLAAGTSDGRMPRNTEPWMALAEQRFWSLILAGDGPVTISSHREGENERHERTRLAAELFLSQTFLWSKCVFDAVKQCPLPSHVIGEEILPFPFMFHSFEVAYGMVVVRSAPDDNDHVRLVRTLSDPESDWLHLSACRGGFNVSMNIVGTSRSGVAVLRSGIKYGSTFPADFPGDERPTEVILSLLAFLQSPYASIKQRKLPRGFRRDGALARVDVDREVSVVTLRRSAQEAVDAYNAEPRAWKHKWWVSGHFRSQWCPGNRSHKVVWIAPYIKGPDGAPILEKVYAVTR